MLEKPSACHGLHCTAVSFLLADANLDGGSKSSIGYGTRDCPRLTRSTQTRCCLHLIVRTFLDASKFPGRRHGPAVREQRREPYSSRQHRASLLSRYHATGDSAAVLNLISSTIIRQAASATTFIHHSRRISLETADVRNEPAANSCGSPHLTLSFLPLNGNCSSIAVAAICPAWSNEHMHFCAP